MQRKRGRLALLLALVMVLAIAGGVLAAGALQTKRATPAGAGGGVSQSTSYRLTGSFSGVMPLGASYSTSETYSACTGFPCPNNGGKIFLPAITR